MKEPSLMDEPSVRHIARAVDAHAGGPHAPRGGLAALAIGAIGVVYGDIGTSPLYAIDQIFFGSAAVAPTPENVLGAISAAIWTIFIIVAVKYALLVLRAENDGEGGVFALYGLLHKYKNRGARVLLWSLMLGAGLLLGDGMITPAISVLSAVEGLDVATPAFAPYVPPITLALLTGLFSIQHKGASGIGVIFGPIMIVWFVVIAVLGGAEIAREPAILAAFNPAHRRSLPRALRPARGAAHSRRADAGHHRRRGDVRGPRAFRRPSDPRRLVRRGLSRAAAQLSRTGRASAWRRANRGRQAVLQPRAGAAGRAARHSGDAGDRRRLAGADFRRVFA